MYSRGGVSDQSISNFGEKWGWYQSIYALSKGNVFRFEKATKLLLSEAMMFLSFEADKNKMESNLMKKKV
jgi:hypothetical protein